MALSIIAGSIILCGMSFEYGLDFHNIDFRLHPELYRIGKGEQGVLLVEPYKSEILPHWRFRTPEIAQKSADAIYQMFLDYVHNRDFVGADMARKFLQMGYTRSRRYANHSSGRKYSVASSDTTNNKPYPYSQGSKNKNGKILPQEIDWKTNSKAQSAQIFKEKWLLAKDNVHYQNMLKYHKKTYEI